jgi:putative acetyltransferase
MRLLRYARNDNLNNNMNYTIRKAKAGEETQLLNLVKTVLSEYKLEIDIGEIDKDLTDLNKYYFNNNGWFFVLEVEGKIVASSAFAKMSERQCELRKMYLLKEFQGNGFGKLLLEESIRKAIELGYKEMVLESNKMLQTANAMYRKYGFEEFTPKHLSNRCDYAMRKIL